MSNLIQNFIFNTDFSQKRYDKIITDSTKLIEKNPKNIMAYLFRAMAEVELGNKEDANKDCDIVISLNPTNIMEYTNIAYVKIKLKMFDDAIKWCDKIIEQEKNAVIRAFGYVNRANAYISIGNYNKALDDSICAIKGFPRSCAAHINKSAALHHLGYYEKAIEECNIALKLKSNSYKSLIYSNIASLKNDIKKHEEAIEYCNKAIEEDSKYSLAYANRGFAKAKLNLFEEAIADCNEAIKIDSTNSNNYITMGRIKYFQGLYNEAIDNYNKAIELDASAVTSAIVYINMAIAKYKLEQYDEAVEFYNKVIELNPQDKKVRDDIFELKNDLASKGIEVSSLEKPFTKQIEYTYTKEDYKQIYKECKKFIYKKRANILFGCLIIIYIYVILFLSFCRVLYQQGSTNIIFTSIIFCIFIALLSIFVGVPVALLVKFVFNIFNIKDNTYKYIKLLKKLNLSFENNNIILNDKFIKEYFRYKYSKKDIYEVKETENYIYLILVEELAFKHKYSTILFALPKNIVKDDSDYNKIIQEIKNI